MPYDPITKTYKIGVPGPVAQPASPGSAQAPAANSISVRSNGDPRIPSWSQPSPPTGYVDVKPGPKFSLPDFSPSRGQGSQSDPRIPAWASPPSQPAPAGPIGISSAPPVQSEADSLNKFYDSQGFGPHSTNAQVDVARKDRQTKEAFGRIAVGGGQPTPANVGLRSVSPMAPVADAPIAAQGQSAPSGYSSPAPAQAQPIPADSVRQALTDQLSDARDRQAHWVGGRTAEDSAAAGNRVVDIANSIGQYDAMRAKSTQGDKMAQLRELSQMPKDAQNLMLSLSGQDSPNIQALNNMQSGRSIGINPLNIESAANDPRLAEAYGILNGPGDLNSKASLFAKVPGIQDPNNPHRQLWDSYMARQSADPEFLEGMRVNRDMQTPYQYLRDKMFGRPAADTQRDSQFESDLKALGYDPYGRPAMSPDQQRARLGVKPADY